MNARRCAFMVVSHELFLNTHGPGASGVRNDPDEFIKVLDGQIARPDYFDGVAKAFLLPSNCIVTGVSAHYLFRNNQIAISLECPDFVETQEGCTMPQTDAAYLTIEDLLGKQTVYFVGWEGGTVPGYLGPETARIDRCWLRKVNGVWMEDVRIGPNGGLIAAWQPEPTCQEVLSALRSGKVVQAVSIGFTPVDLNQPSALVRAAAAEVERGEPGPAVDELRRLRGRGPLAEEKKPRGGWF